MDLGQGNLRRISGTISAMTSVAARPGLSDARDIELALLVVLDGELFEPQAGRFQEAVNGGLGRIDARTFALLADIGGLGRQAFDREHEAARRGVDLRALHRRDPLRQARW